MAAEAVATKRRSTFDLWREAPTWMVLVVTAVGLAICWSGLGEDVMPRLWSPPGISELQYVGARLEPHPYETAPYIFVEPSGRKVEMFCDPWVERANDCIIASKASEDAVGRISFFDARKSNLLGVRHIVMGYHSADRDILSYPTRMTAMREAAAFQDRSRLSGPQLLAIAVYGLPLFFLLFGLSANLSSRCQRA